jgi:excinuclease ABC subunit B
MSENLSEYLQEHNIKVKYLHSDIDTVERVEIIRDLRKGEFDVLVGINLLREGLDIPEVELVSIFDADKEGFLRSDRSLIQTIGRAARNIDGRCILYGDNITGSMQRAMDETSRRREIQMQYNKDNNIQPVSIKKDIRQALDEDSYIENDALDNLQLVSSSKKKFTKVNSNNVTSIISQLEKEMYNHAKNLEFEQAAKIRDQINELQQKYLMFPKAKS